MLLSNASTASPQALKAIMTIEVNYGTAYFLTAIVAVLEVPMLVGALQLVRN